MIVAILLLGAAVKLSLEPQTRGRTILMMLDTLIDASESVAENERRFLAAELKTLALELEELTKAVERSSPAHEEPGEYKARNVA